MLAKVHEAASQGRLFERLEWIDCLIGYGAEELWHETRRDILRRRGFQPKSFSENNRLFFQLANSLQDGATKAGLLAEVMLAKTFGGHRFGDSDRKRSDVCRVFGVDLAKIRSKVKADEKAKAKKATK